MAARLPRNIADGGIELRQRNRQLHGSTLYYGFSPAKAGHDVRPVVASGFQPDHGDTFMRNRGSNRSNIPGEATCCPRTGVDCSAQESGVRRCDRARSWSECRISRCCLRRERAHKLPLVGTEVFSSDVILQVRVGDMALMHPGSGGDRHGRPARRSRDRARSFVAPRRRSSPSS